MENILSMAYGNYNVVFLVVMTLWVTMPMSISMFMTLGALMIGEEEDGSYYSSELGRMSFIGVLSLSYQLSLTIFWKNFFCTLNSFSSATLRGGNPCPWGLLIIVRNFDLWAIWWVWRRMIAHFIVAIVQMTIILILLPSCTHEVDMRSVEVMLS